MQEESVKRVDGVSDDGIGDGVIAALVIYLVADDRVIDIGHVDADLMCAAGFDLDIEQREFVESFSNGPKCQGTAAMVRDLHPESVVLIAADRGVDGAGVLVG